MGSSAALDFHRDPLLCPHPPLTALLVFGHLSDAEFVKSVHMYTEGDTYTVIQQEFRFSYPKYSRVSEPLASVYCTSFSNGSQQLMNTWKRLVINEDMSWDCIFEFHIDIPMLAQLPALLTSSNTYLNDIPSLAYDLGFIEYVLQQKRTESEEWLIQPSPSKQKFEWPAEANLLENYVNATLSAMIMPDATEEMNDTERLHDLSSEVDAFQQWDTNLEIANAEIGNQSIFDPCIIGSSWTCSGDDLCSPSSLPGLATSPPSSSISNHHNNDNSWINAGFPPLQSKVICDESSLSSQLDRKDNSEGSQIDAALSQSSDSLTTQHRATRSKHNKGSRSSERRRSHCSDESVVSLPEEKTIRQQRKGSTFIDPPSTNKQTVASSNGNNSNNNQRGPTERMMEITLDELSQYFHMPITQASKELKVGLTVLKKRCREFGIPRWPHRKLKSLESLIHNIEELSKDSEGRKNFMDAVRELEDQKKSMEESPGIELSERTKRLRQACFKQSYKQRRQALAKLEDSAGI